MKKHALLFLIMYMVTATVLFAGSVKPFIIHTIEDGDTVTSLAEKYFDDVNIAPEILKFNDQSKTSELVQGENILIPVTLRKKAIKALNATESTIQEAREAQAPKYGAELFQRAESLLKSAKKSLNDGSYGQAAALSVLSMNTAAGSIETANLRAPVLDQAIVRAISGTVETDRGERGGWHALKKDDAVSTSARIRTGPLSRADIELADGTSLQLQESSEFMLEDMTRDRRDEKRTTRLRVLIGDITGKIKPRENTNSIFHIDSHGSVTAIRGTRIRLGADEEQTTRLSVLKGLVTMNAADKDVEVAENQGIVVDAEKPPRAPERLPTPPTAHFPADNLTTAVQKITFEWQSSDTEAEIAHYLIEVATDDSFNTIVQTDSTRKMPWVSDTLAPGSYFWRLSSVTPSGLIGDASDAQSFAVLRDLNVRITPSSKPVKKGKRSVVSPFYTFASLPTAEETSAVRYEYSLDGKNYQPLTADLRITEEGEQTIRMRGVGADGQKGKVDKANVYVDATPPSIDVSVSSPRNVSKGVKTFNIKLSANDNTGVERIEYRINKGEFQQYDAPIELGSYSDYAVGFKAVDVVNNETEVRTMAFPAEHMPRE